MVKTALTLALFLATAPLAAATFTITNANDSGPGSLRQAILDANATEERDEIVAVPRPGGYSIVLASSLPAITAPLALNIHTDDQQLVLDGSQVVSGSAAIRVESSAVTLSGLVLLRFSAAGIEAAAEQTLTHLEFSGIVIGQTPTGDDAALRGDGIVVKNASEVTLGGNILSNTQTGIVLERVTNGLLSGNIIVANRGDGVRMDGVNNVFVGEANQGCRIGVCAGPAPNTIQENGGAGLRANGNEVRVHRNEIGSDDPVFGNTANAGDGVVLSGMRNEVSGTRIIGNGGAGIRALTPTNILAVVASENGGLGIDAASVLVRRHSLPFQRWRGRDAEPSRTS